MDYKHKNNLFTLPLVGIKERDLTSWKSLPHWKSLTTIGLCIRHGLTQIGIHTGTGFGKFPARIKGLPWCSWAAKGEGCLEQPKTKSQNMFETFRAQYRPLVIGYDHTILAPVWRLMSLDFSCAGWKWNFRASDSETKYDGQTRRTKHFKYVSGLSSRWFIERSDLSDEKGTEFTCSIHTVNNWSRTDGLRRWKIKLLIYDFFSRSYMTCVLLRILLGDQDWCQQFTLHKL